MRDELAPSSIQRQHQELSLHGRDATRESDGPGESGEGSGGRRNLGARPYPPARGDLQQDCGRHQGSGEVMRKRQEQAETRRSPLEAATGAAPARPKGGKVPDAPAPTGGPGVAATTAPEEPGRGVGMADSTPGGEGAARGGHGAAAAVGEQKQEVMRRT